MNPLNHQLFTSVNQFARATPALHGPLALFATYGVALFVLLLAVVLWQYRHAPDGVLAAVGWAGLGTLVAVGLNQPIASLVAEPRPYAGHPDVLVLVARSTDWSFPSDRSVMAGACAAGLVIVARQVRAVRPLAAVAVVAALLMAATRVYVGAHYPLDVVAGLAVGGAVAVLGWLILRTPLTGLTRWARGLPGVRNAFDARPTTPSDVNEHQYA